MLEKIKDIIVDLTTSDPDEITEEANLRYDLDMSSLDLINLAVELEKDFGIKISNKEIVSTQTVADIIALINH